MLSPGTAVKLNSLILEGSLKDCRYISTSTAFNLGFRKDPIAAGISAGRLNKLSALFTGAQPRQLQYICGMYKRCLKASLSCHFPFSC